MGAGVANSIELAFDIEEGDLLAFNLDARRRAIRDLVDRRDLHNSAHRVSSSGAINAFTAFRCRNPSRLQNEARLPAERSFRRIFSILPVRAKPSLSSRASQP